MGANVNNAFYFLITSLMDVYLGVVLLRILLGWLRADFYNPISQVVWKLTQPLLAPVHSVIPRWRRLDTAACLFLLVLAYLYIQIVMWLVSVDTGLLSSLWFSLLKVGVLTVNVYTISLFAQAVLSWVGPGLNNPAANILWSLNEPLLRPVRRLLPPMAGLDLSPLVVILGLQVISRLLPLPGVFR
jgi:YggT family protein